MDKLIKEKEKNSKLVVFPLDVIPIASLLHTGVPTTTTTKRTSSSVVLPTSVVDESVQLA